jgi:hypothetical protein
MQSNKFNEALEKKIFWLEKRIGMAQRDLWLFKTMVEVTQGQDVQKKIKKVQQLDFLAG